MPKQNRTPQHLPPDDDDDDGDDDHATTRRANDDDNAATCATFSPKRWEVMLSQSQEARSLVLQNLARKSWCV